MYDENNNLKLQILANKCIDDETINKLNQDEILIKYLKKSLLDVYRYKGDFCFGYDELPF